MVKSNDIIIKSSSKGVGLQIVVGALVGVAFVVAVQIIFKKFLTLGMDFEYTLGLILKVSVLVLWLIWSYGLWFKKDKCVFVVSTNSLIMRQYKFLGQSEKIYRFDHIKSLEIKTSPSNLLSGLRQIYIYLTYNSPPLVIKDVDQPEQYVRLIKEKIADSVRR